MNNLKKSKIIRFKKEEIHEIMELYSKKISIGEWKDYSIFFSKNFAIFNIHKAFSRSPEFKILKYYQNLIMMILILALLFVVQEFVLQS